MTRKININIVVVDDEPAMAIGIGRVLSNHILHFPEFEQEAGFHVEGVDSAESFFEKTKTHRPHIVFLDCKLPGMSGLDALEQHAEKFAGIITIMITAYASLEMAIRTTKTGAFDFLAKPFTPEELRYTIRKAVRHFILTERALLLEREKRQLRFEFISVLAHEMKAPLNAVEGYLDIILAKKLGTDVNSYTEMLGRSVNRIQSMRKLIFDLLDLTRIESGQKKRELGTYDLIPVINRSIENLSSEAKKLSLEVTLIAAEPVLFYCDQNEIEILFNNLISNAVKYNKPQGKVAIDVSESETGVEISVADTGIGMEAGDVKKVFNEFVRIKNEKTRNIDGSGLGLTIIKRVSLLYGGNISVESEPGLGSTFKVTLKKEQK